MRAKLAANIQKAGGMSNIAQRGANLGLNVFGGVNAPYIWVDAPKGHTSWQAFDRILNESNVVITPGSGFGSNGEGWFRVSGFNSRANAEEVSRRLQALNW
jgi:LL-diaminopimelate aminotransferase